jgi:hypothetical protein
MESALIRACCAGLATMSARITNVVTLCEGIEDATFLRYFLQLTGRLIEGKPVREVFNRGSGDGKQFVRQAYPQELQAARIRCHQASFLLVVMTDADTDSVVQRRSTLEEECIKQGVNGKLANEPVAIFIPRRNLETWVSYLEGETVNETDLYHKLDTPSALKQLVAKLVKMCQANVLEPDAPESLELSCVEYARVRKLLHA